MIKSLRSIKNYNGNGLLPININHSTVFGYDLPRCAWVLRAEKKEPPWHQPLVSQPNEVAQPTHEEE